VAVTGHAGGGDIVARDLREREVIKSAASSFLILEDGKGDITAT